MGKSNKSELEAAARKTAAENSKQVFERVKPHNGDHRNKKGEGALGQLIDDEEKVGRNNVR